MFALTTFHDLLVRQFQPRSESHGKDLVPACTVHVSQDCSNELLMLINPALKGLLFKRSGHPDVHPELDGVAPVTDMTEVRESDIGVPIVLKTEYQGYRLEVDYGIGGDSNIHLIECKLDEFKIVKLVPSGTIELRYRIHASGVDEHTLGVLGTLVRHTIKGKLIPPTAEQLRQMEQEAATAIAKAKSEAGPGPDAGDIFAGQHGEAPADPPPEPKKAKVHTLKSRMSSAMKKSKGGKGSDAPPEVRHSTGAPT